VISEIRMPDSGVVLDYAAQAEQGRPARLARERQGCAARMPAAGVG